MRRSQLFFVTAALFLFAACTKKESGKTVVTTHVPGSPYTYLMAGSHSFQCIESGYNPSKMSNFVDTYSTSASITFIDSGTIVYSSDTFRYDSTGATTGILYFVFATPVPSISPGYGYLTFDHTTGNLHTWIDQHISAGAGDWQYDCHSL